MSHRWAYLTVADSPCRHPCRPWDVLIFFTVNYFFDVKLSARVVGKMSARVDVKVVRVDVKVMTASSTLLAGACTHVLVVVLLRRDKNLAVILLWGSRRITITEVDDYEGHIMTQGRRTN